MRATRSVGPPADTGTMKRTTRLGHSRVCACACAGRAALKATMDALAAQSSNMRRRVSMATLLANIQNRVREGARRLLRRVVADIFEHAALVAPGEISLVCLRILHRID